MPVAVLNPSEMWAIPKSLNAGSPYSVSRMFAATGSVPSRNQRQAVCRLTPTDTAQSAKFTAANQNTLTDTQRHSTPNSSEPRVRMLAARQLASVKVMRMKSKAAQVD